MEMENFFKECVDILVQKLRSDPVLEKLWAEEIITLDERESIGNLKSRENVRELVKSLRTK